MKRRMIQQRREKDSVSILLNVAKEAFGGKNFEEHPAEYTTMTCHHCNNLNQTGGKLRHTCTTCNREWDIDENAARNLLAKEKNRTYERRVRPGYVTVPSHQFI